MGPSKSHKEYSSQGLASQSNKLPNPYPLGPSNQKEKPRDRPLSAPSQAAIQALMSTDPQLKALQPHPQSPRQVQKPQPGSNPAFNPAVRLVSGRPRGRSHSPCCRIDVDIEPEYWGGWQKGMRPAISHESLMVPSDWEVTACDPTDPLSRSYPDSALSRQRNSYSPVSSGFLQVPDNNHLHFPALDKDRRGRNAERGSTSMCDLSTSAPAGVLKQNLVEVRKMHSRSSHCLLSSSAATPAPWLGLSPRTSPQSSPSYSPTSSGSLSVGTLCPPFSPDNLVSNMAYESSPPIHTHLLLPDHAVLPLHISPASSRHCSPYGSPFGSQTQICVRSDGTEW